MGKGLDDPLDRDARQICAQLAIAAYSLMDQGRYDETAALFAEDAVWVRGGTPVSGRAAIRAALDQRPATHATRHLVTNVLVEPAADGEAVATACFVPLRGALRDDGTVEMPAITTVGDLAYRFRRDPEGWRIARLEPRTVFKP